MKRLWLSFFIIILGYSLTLQARIYILIDQPPATEEQKFPIAVPDLLTIKGSGGDFEVKVPDVIRNDLKMAGYFRVLDKAGYAENPGPGLISEEIDFKKWSAANVLVKGSVESGGGKIILQLRLFDTQTGEMLVGKEYKVDKKNYRAAAHRFMDEIMLALTGEKGVFSTRVAAACGKVGQREIFIMDVDGENRIQLTKNKSINVSPDWSRDGTQIAYTSYEKYFPEIFFVNVNGKGKPKRITFSQAMNITPAWAPDGNTLAVASSMSGDPEIYLFDTQGNQVAQLTRNFGIDIAPTWAPDGQNLVFASERAGGLQLFRMDRDGANVQRLTFAGVQNDQPDWSPKGDKVAYSRRESGIFDIYTVNIDGSMTQKLTNTSGSSESPSYSPDGRYLVYSNTKSYKNDLYIMLWEGSNPTRITKNLDCVNPDWSPWLQ